MLSLRKDFIKLALHVAKHNFPEHMPTVTN